MVCAAVEGVDGGLVVVGLVRVGDGAAVAAEVEATVVVATVVVVTEGPLVDLVVLKLGWASVFRSVLMDVRVGVEAAVVFAGIGSVGTGGGAVAFVSACVVRLVVAGAWQSTYCGDPAHLNTFPAVTGAALLLHAAVSLC